MRIFFSSILIMTGIVLMAGSGGDCDGAGMEYANSLAETAMYGFIGLILFMGGAVIGMRGQ